MSWVIVKKVALFKDQTRGPKKYACISDVEEDQVFLDIREYVRNKPGKNGISLFLPEAQWLNQVIQTEIKIDFIYYFETKDRKLNVLNTETGMRISTETPKAQKFIELNTEERDLLCKEINELSNTFEEYFKKVGGVIKYNFNDYKQSESKMGVTKVEMGFYKDLNFKEAETSYQAK